MKTRAGRFGFANWSSMGLDLTYKADGVTCVHRFSMADWSTIEALRQHLPDMIELCFDVPDFGEAVRIATADLRRCASTIERFLSENSHILPATYQFKLERFPIPGVPVDGFQSGGMGGIRMPNDPDHSYIIFGGDELTLTKMAADSDGRGVIVEKRDLRQSSELITDNCGKITFRRRAKKSELRRGLRKIIEFANRADAQQVTKILG